MRHLLARQGMHYCVMLILFGLLVGAPAPAVTVAQPAGPATLVTDLHTSPVPAGPFTPGQFIAAGDHIFFTAGRDQIGNELWVSDGTEAGTRLVLDIWPGWPSSTPRGLMYIAGMLYFMADDGSHGCELWQSDGTPAGTTMIKDIFPGSQGSCPPNVSEGVRPDIVSLQGQLYFAAADRAKDYELWTSDGTAAGTRQVRDIYPGELSSSPHDLEIAGDLLYFVAAEPGHGFVLWASDGTDTGTKVVTEAAASSFFSLSNLTAVGDTLFFSGRPSASYEELWQSDGTTAGTKIVKGLQPRRDMQLRTLTNVAGKLIFTATQPGSGRELWVSDGSEAGTQQISEIGPGSESGFSDTFDAERTPHTIDGNMLYVATRYGLWRTDGTPAGTLVVDAAHTQICELAASGGQVFFVTCADQAHKLWVSDGSNPATLLGSYAASDRYPKTTSMIDNNGSLLFGAFLPGSFPALWQSGGSQATTQPVMHATVTRGAIFHALYPLNDRLVFSAWQMSTGTEVASLEQGSQTITIHDLLTDPGGNHGSGSNPTSFYEIGNRLLFFAHSADSKRQLWRFDAAADAPELLAMVNLPPQYDAPLRLSIVSDTLYFAAPKPGAAAEIWRSDGTAAGTMLWKDALPAEAAYATTLPVVFGDRMVFAARSADATWALWLSDGTLAGTTLIKTIQPAAVSTAPTGWYQAGNRLFFSATDTDHGTELWVTDGTEAGTTLVKDIAPGTSSASPGAALALGNSLLFTASNPDYGRELWISDGTPVGTIRLSDVATGSADGAISQLTLVGNRLYFSANDGVQGNELWTSDGTPAGTQAIGDLFAGAPGSEPSQLTAFGDQLAFSALGPDGRELWISDGTPAGTSQIADIAPGISSALPGNLAVFEAPATATRTPRSLLLFAASNGTSGPELWRSDGTSAGTWQVQEITAGPAGSLPDHFTLLGDTLYFVADDTDHGHELWAMPYNALYPPLWQINLPLIPR